MNAKEIATDMYGRYLKGHLIVDKDVIMARIRAKESCKISCRETIKCSHTKESIKLWEDILNEINNI